MSRVLEQGLMTAGIPYQVIGGFSFYDRSEIKDCIAILRFLVNPSDGMALSRFVNKPISKIGETTLGQIENYARQNSISVLAALQKIESVPLRSNNKLNLYARCKKIAEAFDFDYKKLNMADVLVKILKDIDYDTFLESKYDKKDLLDRRENIQEFVNATALYATRKGNDIANYLANIALQTSSDKESVENSVSLMSMHASKGLEFPVVFLPGLEEGQLPHKRAINERDGIEEERRLCYVGMTRAKKKLVVSFASSRMQKYNSIIRYEKTIPSRFIKESGLDTKINIVR
jgi:DNA helicase-2/ATP-dependent DNA helicase PcrA